ncbi:hypothetical protein [Flectobacillus roseus]|uniref:Lipoprotein n=1 Tax=Flectobacillus roseus TaxID=502259 RepID=A0ABT6YFC9_9BACT|nr:hypothetical protein [Flectobacillus roseus]MDI9862295.1 hypothetical protein [Flectobacillus roseus]
MTTPQILTLIFTLRFFSCIGKPDNTATKITSALLDTQVMVSSSDTVKKLLVDDYPVKNKMLADRTSNNSSYKKQSGKIFSFDKVWFSNGTLKQTLVFELYTDYHRLAIYHFLDNDIPIDLIRRMELHTEGGEIASDKQKLKDFNGFLQHTTPINSSYFTTKKGFSLGDPKQKAVKTYGNPDKQTITDGIEKLEWLFIGDASFDGKTSLKGKPLANHSFGHQILMYFRNGKLIAQVLHNDAP